MLKIRVMYKFILIVIALSISILANGQGFSTTHHPNGQKMKEGERFEGEPHGLWKEWDDQGRLKKETIYKFGKKQSEKVYNNRIGNLHLELDYSVHPNYGYFKEYTKEGIIYKEQYGRLRGDRINTSTSYKNAWGPRIMRSTKTGNINYLSYFNSIAHKPDLKIEFPIYSFFEDGKNAGVTFKPQYIGWNANGQVRQMNGEIDTDKRVSYRWNEKGERLNNSSRVIINDTLVFNKELCRNQLEYQIVEGYPEGKWTNYYPNGKLWYVQHYNKGFLDGLFEAYYINGQQRYEIQFEKGLMHGIIKEWYTNGQLKLQGQMKQGMLHGIWNSWSEKGQMLYTQGWKDNKMNGEHKKWTPEGKPLLSEYYEDDSIEGKRTEWYPTGQVKLKTFARNRYSSGYYEEYAINGQLIKEHYQNHGLKTTYHPSGKMASIGCQSSDNAATLRVRWTENGDVFDVNYHWANNSYVYVVYEENDIKEIRYQTGTELIKDKVPFSFLKNPFKIKINTTGKRINGKREGKWETFFPTGALWVRQHFKNGKLEGPMEIYNIEGQLIERTVFSNGFLNGPHQAWVDNKTLIREENYVNGLKNGEAKKWYPDGKIASITTYKMGINHGDHISYDTEGRINSSAHYTDGERDGINLFYKYPEGYLWAESTYKAGVRQGPHIVYHPNKNVSVKGSYYKGKKHGSWTFFDKEGAISKVDYYSYGEKDLKPNLLSCQCKADYLSRSKTVFFPAIKSYSEYPQFAKVTKGIIRVPEKAYNRIFIRNSRPEFRPDYGSMSMDLMAFDTVRFALEKAPKMSIVVNPCLKSTQYSHNHMNYSYRHPIRRYVRDFDENTFDHQAKSYFDLACEIVNNTNQYLLDKHIFFANIDSDEGSESYKKLLKELLNKDLITKAQYKSPLTWEELLDWVDDFRGEKNTAFRNLIFNNSFLKFKKSGDVSNNPSFEIVFNNYFQHIGFKKLQEILIAEHIAQIETNNFAVDFPTPFLKQYDANKEQTIRYDGRQHGARLLFEGKQIEFNSVKGMTINNQKLICASDAIIGNTKTTIHIIEAFVFTSPNGIRNYFHHHLPDLGRNSTLPKMESGIYITEASGSTKLNIEGNEHTVELLFIKVAMNGEQMTGHFSFTLDRVSKQQIEQALPKEFNAVVTSDSNNPNKYIVLFNFKPII